MANLWSLVLQLSKQGAQEATQKMDAQLKLLQSKSVSMIGKSKEKTTNKIEPSDMLAKAEKANVDSLVDEMDIAQMTAAAKE